MPFEALLFATLSLSPVVEVTPERFDTAQFASVSVRGGLVSPNREYETGYEAGCGIEIGVAHPYILRIGGDFSSQGSSGGVIPTGTKQAWSMSADFLTYRGRRGTIGYLGGGVVVTTHNFKMSEATMDSLWQNGSISDFSITGGVGYRVYMGLRFSERFFLETSYQHARPAYIVTHSFPGGAFSLQELEGTFGVARVQVGMLFSLVNPSGARSAEASAASP